MTDSPLLFVRERKMKINWSSIEPVRDQATRLRGDYSAQSAIVKLAEQQAEIERLRKLLDDVFAQWDGDWPEELVARVKAAIANRKATGGL